MDALIVWSCPTRPFYRANHGITQHDCCLEAMKIFVSSLPEGLRLQHLCACQYAHIQIPSPADVVIRHGVILVLRRTLFILTTTNRRPLHIISRRFAVDKVFGINYAIQTNSVLKIPTYSKTRYASQRTV